MRTEQEMLDIIIKAAKNDDRIRGAYIYGSRANPDKLKDKYSDYDIAYVVTETESFLYEKKWLDNFGDIVIAVNAYQNQNNYFMKELNDLSRRTVWSMLFTDGNRIDLMLEIVDEAMKHKHIEGEPKIILLDKDDNLPKNITSQNENIFIEKPHENQYIACCSGFWWFISYIAIGVARNQLPYVIEWLYSHNLMTLKTMIEWYIGVQTDFSASIGRDSRYYEKYLPPELHDLYTKTFPHSNKTDIWNAIFSACDLFSKTAAAVGEYFGFIYNKQEEAGMIDFLYKIKQGNSYYEA